MPTAAPYGSWKSPIAPELLVAGAVRLSSVACDGDDIYWNEGRPAEAGRQVIVRRSADGAVTDVVPEGLSARTTVHEYGGRSYDVRDGLVVFSNFADQRLYDGAGRAITPAAAELGLASVRYADHEITRDGAWVLCVRERHPEHGGPVDVLNDLVAVRLADGETVVLADRRDFFSAPRMSPDGRRLAWLSWNHPDMPWDATVLHVAAVDPSTMAVSGSRVVAGGSGGVSVSQPRWSPGGVLHWVSDESGWWRISREDGAPVPFDEGVEYTGPDWVFGQSTYTFLRDGSMVRAGSSRGVRVLEGVGGELPFSSYESVVAAGDGESVVCLAAAPDRAAAVVRVARDGQYEVLRSSQDALVDGSFISRPEPIEFPTTGDRTAHALYYAPHNPEHVGPPDERPPLIVLSHGGPTSATSSSLNLGIQYWTTRGVAVVDVNYGGSTGYGREYRERLRGTWGIVDVDDCVHAALHLAASDRVDPSRLVIRGGSAGGYTTLAALTFRPGVFAAGSSHYGVADAEALARDTHKFESRYLDGLIGPYPEAVDLYKERSPIHHTDALSCPLILFQGLEDKVVPPEQSEMMAEALADKGIPHAYVAFEGEQHGFRKADSIVTVAQAELSFLGRVLGFTPADEVPPVKIVHEERLVR